MTASIVRKVEFLTSLPTSAYTGGNIRDYSLRTIIEETEELRFNLGADTPKGTEHLWGFCKTCEFAELCRGGCSWTAHVFFNKRGNNPYCHHRTLTQAKRGIRERVFLKRRAERSPTLLIMLLPKLLPIKLYPIIPPSN